MDGSTISNVVFKNNFADRGGAVFGQYVYDLSISYTLFMFNAAGKYGGALYLASCGSGSNGEGTKLYHSQFYANKAAISGGAIYLEIDVVGFSVYNTSMILNIAQSGNGGAVYIGSTCSQISIGGFSPKVVRATYGVTSSTRSFSSSDVEPYASMYVVFDASGTSKSKNCGDMGLVNFGGFSADQDLSSDSKLYCRFTVNRDSNTWPGLNGNKPFYLPSGDITITTRLAKLAFVSLLIFPTPAANTNHTTNSVIFSLNKAGNSGGALFFASGNTYVFITPGTVFEYNSANVSGGAIVLGSSNQYVYMYSVTFRNNRASNGGAFLLSQMNSPVRLESCVFQHNIATQGGALYVDIANGNGLLGQSVGNDTMLLYDCHFVSNTAASNVIVTGKAGAIYLGRSNAIKLQFVTIENNTAADEGGAIYSNQANIVTVAGISTFVNNRCIRDFSRGGAVSVNGGSLLSLLDFTNFSYNGVPSNGGEGGAIYISSANVKFAAYNSLLIGNEASYGSAVSINAAPLIGDALELELLTISGDKNHIIQEL